MQSFALVIIVSMSYLVVVDILDLFRQAEGKSSHGHIPTSKTLSKDYFTMYFVFANVKQD